MNGEWQHFLGETGVFNLADSGPDTDTSSGGDGMLAQSTLIAPVPDEAVLRVSGADAEAFLQGQFSNDVAALADPGSQLTTWSTPKGRVLALFRLIRIGDSYLIRIPRTLADAFVKRLRMYVLMSKVVVEDQPDQVSFGISGVDAASLLETVGGQPPSRTDDCVVDNNLTIVRVRGEPERFEVTAPVSRAIEIWKLLSISAVAGDESTWRLQDIDAGVPRVDGDTSEAFVLQMLNLQHIDGVSFKKGCFPGQEVVARMQYLGKLKRRMYLLTGDATAGVPASGSDLYVEGKSSAIGKVVDAQPVGDDTFRMLAVCAIEAMEQPVYLNEQAQHAVSLLELPYSLDVPE